MRAYIFAQLLERMGVWEREMVLGRAPEFRLAGPPRAGIAPRTVQLRPLYRSGF